MSTNRLPSIWRDRSADHDAPALASAKLLVAKLEPMIENVGMTIADHPRASLTLAATLGALLGWFIKRT
jgi:hypothetical protein